MAGDLHISTIPAGIAFAENFAAKLLQQYQENPEKIAEILILLPTRRSCRLVREAFLRQSGGAAMILPRLQTIGDVDEDAISLESAVLSATGTDPLAILPAIAPMRRKILLTQMILANPQHTNHPEHAMALADALATLIDRAHTEGVEMNNIRTLVGEADLAEHWGVTVRFLEIILENWPAILAEQGRIDPADRRNRLLHALADHWETHPPAHPVYAAGSTGSIPAVRRLLGVIAKMPDGHVILPALDRDIDPASWAALSDTHPQATLKTLLDSLGLTPSAVPLWDESVPLSSRSLLAREIMRPPDTTGEWRNLRKQASLLQPGLPGLQRFDCTTAEEEAALIALIFRHVQHTPGKTAALVTFDRGLARRVATACARFGIVLDDSAGQYLNTTPMGSWLDLCAETCVQQMAPVPLLSLLKHPHAALGMDTGDLRGTVRKLDRALRGLRPAPGIDGLKIQVQQNTALNSLISALSERLSPMLSLCNGQAHPFSDWLKAHITVAESLAESPQQKGAERLWTGEDGGVAAEFLATLVDHGVALPPVTAQHYVRIMNTLMQGVQVRKNWGTHPRLAILGPLEARMLQADLVILGGMNEGSWPGDPDPDPWMSRPMRAKFGLPSTDRGVGLSAHDFVLGFCTPEVILTRADRVGGTPGVPSRWLQRMDAVLDAAGLSLIQTDWLEKVRSLDKPDSDTVPEKRPEPRPPVRTRPVRLSVTEIEAWVRDPYSVYARRILGLEHIDMVDEILSVADLGTIVHKILESFVSTYRDTLPEDAYDRLMALADPVLDEKIHDPRTRYFWGLRFQALARWFINHESEWRTQARPLALEKKGEWVVPETGFTLSAKADRVDRMLDGSGAVAIIDYKTGSLPSKKAVEAGLSPQLPLEAAMVRAGAFLGIGPVPVGVLAYWQVGGTGDGGKDGTLNKTDPDTLADAAEEGLKTLIRAFADEATPYYSIPRPAARPRYNDYEHLARVQEWAVLGDDEADSGEAA